MQKVLYLLLNVFTLGTYHFLLTKKAKNKIKSKSNKLTYNDKIDFDIDNFLNELGGKENIKKISSTINTLTISINEKISDDFDYKKFGAKGLVKTENKLIFVFGDNSPKIEEELNKKIK